MIELFRNPEHLLHWFFWQQHAGKIIIKIVSQEAKIDFAKLIILRTMFCHFHCAWRFVTSLSRLDKRKDGIEGVNPIKLKVLYIYRKHWFFYYNLNTLFNVQKIIVFVRNTIAHCCQIFVTNILHTHTQNEILRD